MSKSGDIIHYYEIYHDFGKALELSKVTPKESLDMCRDNPVFRAKLLEISETIQMEMIEAKANGFKVDDKHWLYNKGEDNG